MEVQPMIIAIYRQYARIYQLLQNGSANGVPHFDSLKDGFTLSAYLWAVQIIQTRQNGYPGMNRMELNDLLLIPVLDLCNHSFEPTARISKSGSDEENGKNFHHLLSKVFEIISLKMSAKNEFFKFE